MKYCDIYDEIDYNLLYFNINISDMIKGKEKYKIISKYQIDYSTLLGRGAMASVYLGYYA